METLYNNSNHIINNHTTTGTSESCVCPNNDLTLSKEEEDQHSSGEQSETDSLSLALASNCSTGPIIMNTEGSLHDRFAQLQSLIVLTPTLFDSKSINCELLFDVLNCVYYESQRWEIAFILFRFLRFYFSSFFLSTNIFQCNFVD